MKTKKNSRKILEYLYSGESYLRFQPKNFDEYVKNSKKAVDFFNKILKLNFKNNKLNFKNNLNRVYRGLGIAYLNLGEYEKAIKYFNKALEFSSEDIKINFSLGLSFRKLGYFNKAIKYFNKVLDSKTESPVKIQTYNGLGMVYLELKNYNKAISCFNQAVKLKGEPFFQAQAYNGLGMVYLELKNYNKAISCFNKSLKIASRLNTKYRSIGNNDKSKFISVIAYFSLMESYYKKGEVFKRNKMAKRVSKIINSLSKRQRFLFRKIPLLRDRISLSRAMFLLKKIEKS